MHVENISPFYVIIVLTIKLNDIDGNDNTNNNDYSKTNKNRYDDSNDNNGKYKQ